MPVETLHIVTVGTFGNAVSSYFKVARPGIIETQVSDSHPLQLDSFPRADLDILISWRPVPNVSKLLDDFSHKQNRPFISVILDSAILRIGPIVVPGKGSCWECWFRRSKQHAPKPEEYSVLLEHYSSNVTIGPKGFLEPFAALASARLEQIVSALESGVYMPGSLWQMNLLSRQMTKGIVVGVHDCPKCGLQRPSVSRSFEEMRERLTYLWEPVR